MQFIRTVITSPGNEFAKTLSHAGQEQAGSSLKKAMYSLVQCLTKRFSQCGHLRTYFYEHQKRLSKSGWNEAQYLDDGSRNHYSFKFEKCHPVPRKLPKFDSVVDKQQTPCWLTINFWYTGGCRNSKNQQYWDQWRNWREEKCDYYSSSKQRTLQKELSSSTALQLLCRNHRREFQRPCIWLSVSSMPINSNYVAIDEGINFNYVVFNVEFPNL